MPGERTVRKGTRWKTAGDAGPLPPRYKKASRRIAPHQQKPNLQLQKNQTHLLYHSRHVHPLLHPFPHRCPRYSRRSRAQRARGSSAIAERYNTAIPRKKRGCQRFGQFYLIVVRKHNLQPYKNNKYKAYGGCSRSWGVGRKRVGGEKEQGGEERIIFFICSEDVDSDSEPVT